MIIKIERHINMCISLEILFKNESSVKQYLVIFFQVFKLGIFFILIFGFIYSDPPQYGVYTTRNTTFTPIKTFY